MPFITDIRVPNNGDYGITCNNMSVTASTAMTVTGVVNANGGIAVDTNKFTVADGTGNTNVAGTIGVAGASTLTGAVACGSTLTSTGDFDVNSDKFTVASASGNTAVAGTLGVTGAATLSSTLDVTGATGIDGDFDIATNKFTVASASGNTAVAGTLGVTGAATLSSTLDVTGATGIDGDFDINTDKFTVASASGNTAVAGTLGVTGAATLSSTLDVTGATGIDGDFDIATDKFTVASASGNTAVAGTLDVTGATGIDGNFDIATNKFTVLAASGNTAVAGTLGVTGAATLSSTLDVTGATGIDGDFDIATNKFTVASSSGNTAVAGTLVVSGEATLQGVAYPANNGSAGQVLTLTDANTAVWQTAGESASVAEVTAETYSLETNASVDIVCCDSNTNAITITMADMDAVAEKFLISDVGGNAATNNITIVPKPVLALDAGTRKTRATGGAANVIKIKVGEGASCSVGHWITANGETRRITSIATDDLTVSPAFSSEIGVDVDYQVDDSCIGGSHRFILSGNFDSVCLRSSTTANQHNIWLID